MRGGVTEVTMVSTVHDSSLKIVALWKRSTRKDEDVRVFVLGQLKAAVNDSIGHNTLFAAQAPSPVPVCSPLGGAG
jgi:hypothetical protein